MNSIKEPGEILPVKQRLNTYRKYNDGRLTLKETFDTVINGGDPEFNKNWSDGDRIADDLRRITSFNRGILKPNGEQYSNGDVRNIVLGKISDPTEYLTRRKGRLYIEKDGDGKYRIHRADKHGGYEATLMRDKNTVKEYGTLSDALEDIKNHETGRQPQEPGADRRQTRRKPAEAERKEKGLFDTEETEQPVKKRGRSI
jgi:hypothetical protein